MCGICGVYSTNYSKPEQEIFRDLLLLNVWRGHDSTGLVRIGKNKSVKSYRSLLPSPSFVESDAAKAVMDPKDDVLGIIGHTRSATKGSIDIKNAHPFSFPSVAGVHNGTIHRAFKHSAEYDTDSEALYKNINEYGIEQALCEIKDSDPAYVLNFVDKKERTLNFIRNDKRPLFFTYLYGRSTLVWSSEKSMIQFVLDRRGYKTNEGWQKEDKGHDGYFYLKRNDLLTIKLGETPDNADITHLDIPEPKATTYNYSYATSGVWTNDGYGGYTQGSNRTPTVPPKGKDKFKNKYKNHAKDNADLSGIPWMRDPKEERSNVIPLPTLGMKPLSASELNYKLSLGCLCCGSKVLPEDEEEVSRVHWWSRDHYACNTCYTCPDNEWVRLMYNDPDLEVSVH